MKRLVLAAALFLFATSTAFASTTCVFTSDGTTWTLTASCTTDTTIRVLVPNLAGNGYTITAIDASPQS
jgi:hypothetical protein